MKRTRLSQLSIAVLFALTVVWWAVAVALKILLGEAGMLAAVAIVVFGITFLLLEILFRVAHMARLARHDQRQNQALLGLYTELRPRHALPTLGDAALSPDTALEYVKLIRQLRPQIIVELGSGVSTLLATFQLRENGSGRVIAIDHEEKWANATREDLDEHGMLRWAEIRYAPLTSVEVDGDHVPWYDPKIFKDIDRIDLLLIDGPPDYHDAGNRRPGLTQLAKKFSEDVVVLVDDGHRPRWNSWVHHWAKENGFVIHEPFLNEKKALILYRKDSALGKRASATPDS